MYHWHRVKTGAELFNRYGSSAVTRFGFHTPGLRPAFAAAAAAIDALVRQGGTHGTPEAVEAAVPALFPPDAPGDQTPTLIWYCHADAPHWRCGVQVEYGLGRNRVGLLLPTSFCLPSASD